MMNTIIMISVFLIFIIALHATNMTGARPNGNILLGVTLPYDALKDGAVAAIIGRYKKACSLACVIFSALAIPVVFVVKYISITLLYLLIWIVAFLYANQKVIAKHWSELYSLKRERGWWMGTPNTISIDTEVSRLKDTFPVSKKWFAIPLAISATALVAGIMGENREMAFWAVQLGGMLTLAIFFLIHLSYGRDRTRAYSENTEVNLALNRAYKREWTKCWLTIACMNSVVFALIACFIMLDTNQMATVIIAVIILLSGCVIIPILHAHNKVRDTRNKLLRLVNEDVYADDDEYWGFGTMFYNNPNDSRSMVEKRIGYGQAVNMASGAGKAVYVSLIGTAGIFIGVVLLLLPLDFGSVSLAIDGQTARIEAAMYDYAFSLGEVKSVTLIDEFPRATRTNGGSGERVSAGRFRVSGYGASQVYIHRDNPPYIAVELEDGWVFLNGETRERTEAYFSELMGGKE